MNPLTLGRLEKVELREIWTSEAVDFTPWLARPENLEVLASALGLELEVEAQEKEVGPFRADILCKDLDGDSWVLIENQLERTDHTHLGQLLTYAAGLQAVTIIWVAARFSEEHRASLDWLNEITDERFRFFGLEVELWKIGSSPAAPKFNVVSKPNDWTRSVSKAARRISDEPVSETKALQLKYWTALKEYLTECGSKLRSQKPHPQHWIPYYYFIRRRRYDRRGRLAATASVAARRVRKIRSGLSRANQKPWRERFELVGVGVRQEC